MIQEFASLHNHSHFSLFDGLSLPDEIVKAAKEKGLRSIALTDHGVVGGHADLFLCGKKHGVKVVFGVEAYVIHSLEDWRIMREGGVEDSSRLRQKGHLVILACDREGLSNLYDLVYHSSKDGFYGKPRMDKEMLRAHARGLVASSACMGGVVSKACWEMKDGKLQWADVVREAREFDDIFGRGRFFLELQLNEHPGQKFINECMVRISRETGIPLTVTTDSHYAKAEEWEAREVMHMLDWDKTVADFPNGKIDAEIKQLYIKSPEEMWRTYELYGKDHIDEGTMVEAFQNTLLIDSLVTVYEPDTHMRLRTLKVENPFRELGRRALDGLRNLGLAGDERYKQQLLHELTVIKEKGLSNYFLIVQETIAAAKKVMFVGPGRGSSGGSLVCYCAGITDLDPIEHGLMFERFLDPARSENPDIDIDFEDPSAVKQILRQIYGEDNVASLSTYGTFQIKGLLKDLGRVYGVDHNVVNTVNKKIEAELKVLYVNQDKSTIVIKLEDVERVSPTFRKFCEEHPDAAGHLKYLYGRNRQVGRHASGVIIGDDLPRETGLFWAKGKEDGKYEAQTAFTEGIVNKNISAMGFVKFDLLGLANLKVIHYALKLISKKTGQSVDELRESIRDRNLPKDDPKVLKHVFWDGNFAGVFQFTEKGIRGLARRIKPDGFKDVSAVTSLYRPGPLGSKMHDLYYENKMSGKIEYDHPLLESVLGNTYGCLVYQEQLMRVCNVLGKLSWKDVNRVRKVLLKKDKSKSEEFLKKENDELQGKFVAGCLENGLTKEKADEWWKKLLFFGGYGFNKAHSDAYSIVTMQGAYLATYHPLEYYTALLTKGQASEIQQSVSDIQKCGIKILPVDINRSKMDHTTEDGSIRLSMLSPKGVGPAAVEKIVANQPYTSFEDFLDRSGASKTAVEPLIMVGAFQSIAPHTKNLYHQYMAYVDEKGLDEKGRTRALKLKTMRPQLIRRWQEIELFGRQDDFSLQERIATENELLSFSLAGSPFEILDRKEKAEKHFHDVYVTDFDEHVNSNDKSGVFLLSLKGFKEKPQKNKQMMAFMRFGLEDGREIEAPCFGGVWKWIRPKARPGSVYLVTMHRDADEEGEILEPEKFKVGKPGWAQSQISAERSFIDLDAIKL